MDVAQAFDKVKHSGFFKLKLFLPSPLYLLICSYLENHSFSVCLGNYFSFCFHIHAEVSQGSSLSPDLFNIFTPDIPQVRFTILATYADDPAMLSSNIDPVEASLALHYHLKLTDDLVTGMRN